MRKITSTVAWASAALIASLGSPVAQAGVFGSLANFDVVNDTGQTAHGFEIEIEDSHFDHAGGISSVFGLDRNFGVPANSVERYGAPTIDYIAGFGARITYKASFANGAWGTGTASGVFAHPGDSCWTLGGVGYPNVPCDHFGVATLGSPAKINYHWLLETAANSSVLNRSLVGIPSVSFTPAAPGAANQAVQVRIQAVAPPVIAGQAFGAAYWVKTFKTEVDHNVKLDNLLRHNADVEAAQTEVEWEVFQANANADGKNEFKAAVFDLGANGKNGKAEIRRYEFYKYTGPLDPNGEGEVLCDGADPAAFGHACDNPFGDGKVAGINDLGNFVGAQIAGFNANEVAAAVPEPSTYVLLLAGLGLIGLRASTCRSKSNP